NAAKSSRCVASVTTPLLRLSKPVAALGPPGSTGGFDGGVGGRWRHAPQSATSKARHVTRREREANAIRTLLRRRNQWKTKESMEMESPIAGPRRGRAVMRQ